MGRKRLYSDEERKQKNREKNAKYRAKHPDKVKEKNAKWRAENPDYNKEYGAKWYQENRDKKLEQNAQWRVEHPDYFAKYYRTPMGKAVCIAANYDREDEKYNRGKCTLTPIWIIDNIFPMPCHYCGDMGWEIMGCDRVDNSLPHTPDNVVPCCAECNRKRGRKSYEEFMEMLNSRDIN